MQAEIDSPLNLTSQFSHCSLPLRLDSYRGCSFACNYCFARARGGNSPSQKIVTANPNYLTNVFRRIDHGESETTIRQFLVRQVPIHFGGMSDPFQPRERRERISFSFLAELQRRNYPTVISTKSSMVAEYPYIDLLTSGWRVVIQFSLTSTEDKRAAQLEPHAIRPSVLLNSMEQLAELGVPVSARWQPYVETIAEPPDVYVRRVADAGAFHLSLEHLKVPLEERGWASTRAGISMSTFKRQYQDRGAWRDGREYVLPSPQKVSNVLLIRTIVHRYNMTFGAADNDLQFLSDGEACCSGIDRFPGFEHVFKRQIALAVKRRTQSGVIKLASIEKEWCPKGSIDRYLNSHSRISGRTGSGGTLRDHITARWENLSSPANPLRYFGVRDTGRRDKNGNRIFKMEPPIPGLIVD
jgi:DNA repair photolyase